jgi:hypothetical protein
MRSDAVRRSPRSDEVVAQAGYLAGLPGDQSRAGRSVGRGYFGADVASSA